jgi:hypothetical protein
VASPAKISRWLANVPVLPENAPVYIGKLYDLWMNLDQNTLFSKMYPAFSHLTKEGILELSSGKWLNVGTVSHGVCLTLPGSEYPNVVVESSLSDVLMQSAPAKYLLSTKACQGILRRSTRGRGQLPEALEKVLRNVVREEQEGAK